MPQFRKVAILLSLMGSVLMVANIALPLYGVHVIPEYLPLHTILESFTVVVASLVFSVGWNAYRRELPNNVLFIACAFLGVAILDFSHMLSFTGMPDFVTPSGPNKAIYFWLAAQLVGCHHAAYGRHQALAPKRILKQALFIACRSTFPSRFPALALPVSCRSAANRFYPRPGIDPLQDLL